VQLYDEGYIRICTLFIFEIQVVSPADTDATADSFRRSSRPRPSTRRLWGACLVRFNDTSRRKKRFLTNCCRAQSRRPCFRALLENAARLWRADERDG